jgi:hypothetical protein
LRELIRQRDREVKAAKHQTALHWKGDVHAKKELQEAVDYQEALQRKLLDRDQQIQKLEDELAKERAEKDEIVRNAATAAEAAALYKQNTVAEQAALKSRLCSLSKILQSQVETMRKDQHDIRADFQALTRFTKGELLEIAATSKRGKEADDLALATEKEAVVSAENVIAQLQSEVQRLQGEIVDLKQNVQDCEAQLAAKEEEDALRRKEAIKNKVASKWQNAARMGQEMKAAKNLEKELEVRDARLALFRNLKDVGTMRGVQPSDGSTTSLRDYPSILQLQGDLAKRSSSPRPCCPPEYLVLELVDICEGARNVAFPLFQKMGQRLVERAVSALGGEEDASSKALLEFRAAPPKDIGIALLEQRARLLRPYEVCFLHAEIILRNLEAISLDALVRLAHLEFPMDQLDSPCLVGIREPIGKRIGHGGKPLVILDLTVQGFACEILVSEELQLGEAQSTGAASVVDHRELALLIAAYGEPKDAGTTMSVDLQADMLGHCDSWGFSALHYAAAWGRVRVIRDILVASPSAALAVDAAGRFAFHRAVENGHLKAALWVVEKVTDAIDSEKQRPCIYDLVASASPAEAPTRTAESNAIQDRLVELLIILSPRLRKISDVSQSDNQDIQRVWEQLVHLLKHAVDSDLASDSVQEQGRLLHGIVAAGCPAFAIEHLMNVANGEKGMSRLMGFGVPDKEGCTPIDLAASFDDAEAPAVIDCLLRHGGQHSPSS